MSKQVNYNENLCSGAAIRDDKGRRISKLFEASHPKMTVGYAKNLIMPDTPTEQEFNFRQAGGGVIEDGVAVIDKVKGKSIVWNQLANKILNGTTAGKGLTITLENGVFTVNGTTTEDGWVRLGQFWDSLVKGHKTLRVITPISGTCSVDFSIGDGYSENNVRYSEKAFINYYNLDNRTTPDFYLISTSGTTFTNLKFKVQSIDLTQVYGAGNEPSTYEEFLSRKPKVADEYAYNEGTIVNNKVEKVVTTGRNLWDEECETSQNEITSKNFNPIIPGVRIYVKCPANSEIRFNWYDANKEYVSYYYTHNVESQVPANAHYFKILTYQYGPTYNNDICINISDPAINGKYFPYEEHTLDLSWVKDIKDGEGVKLFEDGMKSAGTAFDEAEKNKAVRRVGVVDLGTLNWTKALSVFYAIIENIAPLSGPKDVLCAKYASMGDTDWSDRRIDKSISHTPDGNLVSIRDDAYTDAASFKAAMAGVKLYYELAEPIEVEYDEKNLTYPVVAGGTEEAIASEPSTAFRADIGYGIDAVKTILDLKARVEALEGK